MRVLVWATTLQADILALAQHLDQRPDTELLVATEGLEAWLNEPMARVRPFRAPMLDRRAPDTPANAMAFRADVVVCDNHFPEFPAAPRLCFLWHGLGWKAKDAKDLEVNVGHIERLTGASPRNPNPCFLAQCYHDRDRDWRVERWGFAPGNCEVTGSCFSDLILAPPYTRAELAPSYRIDVVRRPTLVLNLGWHYGRIFPGSWQPRLFGRSPMAADLAFVRSLFERARARGANVLFCLHDRWRYEPAYLEALGREAARFPEVELKHKDERPDNLADLLVADAWVSNLSSFVTFFYHLGKPSVHLCPRPGAEVRYSRVTRFGLRARRADRETEWMNQPEDNGGLTACDAEEAEARIEQALTEPDCCRVRARDWLARHVARSDGQASRRLGDAIARLSAAG
jgi:hypothetical protein